MRASQTPDQSNVHGKAPYEPQNMASLIPGLFVTTLLLPASTGEEYLLVKDKADVYTAKFPPYDGTSHGDGVAALDLTGIVVEIVGEEEKPVADVKFSVEPDRSFSYWRNRKIIFLSNSDGEFMARLYVGAAMTVGGKNPGTVYQTSRSTLRIEKAGYKNKTLLFDYDMPPAALQSWRCATNTHRFVIFHR